MKVNGENYTLHDVREIENMCARLNELSYQQKHRKVKDRYASEKFYMNNFKKRKMKKK